MPKEQTIPPEIYILTVRQKDSGIVMGRVRPNRFDISIQHRSTL